MASVFLVEDEQRVATFIMKGLIENGYEVDLVHDGAEAIKKFQEKPYDILILDVMLPYVSGVEVCKHIRQKDRTIPILMLTALGTIDNKVNGLKAGADDYMVKPFHFKELLARVEALLRRASGDGGSLLQFEELIMNLDTAEVSRAGKKISLTAKEFALLELLMKNPNKILTRAAIAERVWGIDFDTGTNVVDVYVNYLRNKTEKGFTSKYIHTVIGKGYVLKAD